MKERFNYIAEFERRKQERGQVDNHISAEVAEVADESEETTSWAAVIFICLFIYLFIATTL
jgi:hypothetical protein